jgi:hypothetical protein
VRIAVVPGTLALQERYASLTDPIPELRAAVAAATEWADQVFVINGSARRTQASPGPFDERAVPFDDRLFEALSSADDCALADLGLDEGQALARDLWATTDAVAELARALVPGSPDWSVTVDYEGAPTGVAWWVIRYES